MSAIPEHDSTTTPPTTPTTAVTRDEPTESTASSRLARLENRMKWLMFGLISCAVIIAGLGITTGILLQRHATLLIEQQAEERAQLRLLTQLQQDFEQLEIEVPQNRIQAYGQLRGQLKEIEALYEPMANFDVGDPMGSLDALLGDDGPAARRRAKAREAKKKRDDELMGRSPENEQNDDNENK